jgi:peptidoglycan/xylan/chitin deacetylase (PgdA/CDA1 family)
LAAPSPTGRVRLHGIAGAAGSPLERSLGADRQLFGGFTPLIAPLESVVTRVTAPPAALNEAGIGLPEGPAREEAIAVRLRRRGFQLEWGTPREVADVAVAIDLFERWGCSSVEVIRADPALLPELQIGGWFLARMRARLLRRLTSRSPAVTRALPQLRIRRALLLRAAVDAAFWRGVRSVATDREWRRLTTGYAVVLYHRLAGDHEVGEERLDVPPRHFDAQMRLLRLLRFRPLSAQELLAFHLDDSRALEGRRYVVTIDDALLDTLPPLRRNAANLPQLFVPTGAVGRVADWLGRRPVAGWHELLALRDAGVALGGHSRTHPTLSELDDAALRSEIAGSRADLESRLEQPPVLFAYPYGQHDERVRDFVAEAGYRLAFTTLPGMNGAGTDRYCLHRLSVKSWDSGASFLWKVLTGEPIPAWWERWLRRRARARPQRVRVDPTGHVS